MATIEKDTLLSVKDLEGNLVLLYPTTKSDLVMYNEQTVDEAISNLESATSSYAFKSKIKKAKLFANSWEGNVYSFPEYSADGYDVEIFLDGDATQEELEAYANAMFVGNISDNTLKAFGEVPEIDIPIVIKSTQKTDDIYATDIFIVLNDASGSGTYNIPVESNLGIDIYRGSTLIGQTDKYWGLDSYAFSIEYEDENQLKQILEQECKLIFTKSTNDTPINVPVESFTVLEEDGLVKVVISVDENLYGQITSATVL